MAVDPAELIRNAQATRVVVIGGGIAGLVAAYECARIGMPVTVFEAAAEVGGSARTLELDGQRVDVAASGFRATGELATLIRELHLEGELIVEATSDRWTNIPSGLTPLPSGVLGVPANPFLTPVIKIIGWGGAWRAYLDRLRPPLTIGHALRLGDLVRARMGAKVLNRLVWPATRGGFGLAPADVDVDVAAPGLNAALTTQGSLSGAVAVVENERTAVPLRTFRAGIGVLATALTERIREFDGEVLTSVSVQRVSAGDDGFRIETVGADDDAEAHTADVVIIATGAESAREMLGVPNLPSGIGVEVDVVTTVVPLGGAACGAGIYTQPERTTDVWSIDDESARWAQRGAASTRVLRSVVAADGRTTADSTRLATELVQNLLGVGAPLAVHTDRQRLSAPASAVGHAEHTAAVRAVANHTPGLAIVGAWVSGSGLSAVVADAAQESERVRRAVLFGEARG